MRNDPASNGGLFIGRRPGTGPLRFRTPPARPGATRQRIDGLLAWMLASLMVAISLLCCAPIPVACVWLGSQIQYLSASASLGMLIAFVALFPSLFGMLVFLRDVDRAWILVRRGAGHDQRTGVMVRIFVATALFCAVTFAVFFLVIRGFDSNVLVYWRAL